MRLLLIRHAESNGNAAGGDYSVDNADALSPRGLAQAEELASCLVSWEIDTVIVSPAQRALQTIAPYLARTGLTAEVWPEMAEACWQEEREPPADAWASQPTALPDDIAQHFTWRDGQAIRPAWPETFGSGLRRVHDTVARIESAFGRTEQTVVLTAHGYFIRETLNRLLKLTEPEPFHHENCGMTLMTCGKPWRIEFCNRQADGVEVRRSAGM